MEWISCCAAVSISEWDPKLQKLGLCFYFLHSQTEGRNPKAQGHEKRSLLLFSVSFFFFFLFYWLAMTLRFLINLETTGS